MSKRNVKVVAKALSAAIEAGAWQHGAIVSTIASLTGPDGRWMTPLAHRILRRFSGRPLVAELIEFLGADQGLRRAVRKYRLRIRGPALVQSEMRPTHQARSWPIRPLLDQSELADWLDVTQGELLWFADRRCWEANERPPALHHYRYVPIPKRAGEVRLIEAPKRRLKAIQQQILHDILEHVPAHHAAHGFAKGRSPLTFARPHVGCDVVLRFDLRQFFPSMPAGRVRSLFRMLGYPRSVAETLSALCLNTAPEAIWKSLADAGALRWEAWHWTRQLYGRPHLPQGAPTSPALANLGAYRLDCRLAGLARSEELNYTRYADDFAFSGSTELARASHRFILLVNDIVREEGFRLQLHKTRVMRQGARQRIAGVVVNQRLNSGRRDYETLKAILHNCVRNGPSSENRDEVPDFRAHLLGRIAYMRSLNPSRGDKLLAKFEKIFWN